MENENENKNLEAEASQSEEKKTGGPGKLGRFLKPAVIGVMAILIIIILIIGRVTIKKMMDANKQLGIENAQLKAEKSFLAQNNPPATGDSNSRISSSDFSTDSTPPKTATYIHTDYSDVEILKGQISWNKSKKLDDLGLFQSVDKYTNVGKVTQGEYSGYDFDIAWINPEGPQIGYDKVRFLKKDNNYLILGNYSSVNYSSFGALNDIQAAANPDFNGDKNAVSYSENVLVEELETPKFLYGPNPGQILIEKTSSDSFSTDLLRAAFTDAKWGTIWVTDAQKAEKNKNQTETFGRSDFDLNGFYIALPDGTSDSYALSMDTKKILDITWNNGDKLKSAETDNYAGVMRSGCGQQNFADVFTGKMDDLTVTGKNSSGQDVYEYKDANNEVLKNLYDQAYWGENDSQKISYDKFVQEHPIIFVSDSFGRMIQFTTTKYPPLAECGKPVIYLYPQEKTRVDVQVQPLDGITVSEPAYQNGWQVIAGPDGQLTNIADNKNYPYLFWEGRGSTPVQIPNTGFVVEKNNLDKFLDQKLAQAGLIEKEINDFKAFWLPRMLAENKPYYLITFMGNGYMNKIAPLNIDPKPDTIIRILMNYQGLDNKINVRPEEIKTPPRKGFTAVEWGGVLNK